MVVVGVDLGCSNVGTNIGDPSPNDQNDNGSADPSGDNPAMADPVNLAEAAVIGARVAAGAVAAVRPTKDFQAIFESGQSPPFCPSLTAELGTDGLTTTLQYGQGCAPDAYASLTFGGSVQGTSFTALNAFEFRLEALSTGTDVIDGVVAGGFTPPSESTTFAISIDLTLDDGTAVQGSVIARVSESSVVLIIDSAGIVVIGSDGLTRTVSLEGVEIDPRLADNLVPFAGEARVTQGGLDSSVDPDPAIVEFTSQTPFQ
jgi:hypothetical protein